jgi:hypothetical protein
MYIHNFILDKFTEIKYERGSIKKYIDGDTHNIKLKKLIELIKKENIKKETILNNNDINYLTEKIIESIKTLETKAFRETKLYNVLEDLFKINEL